MICVGDIMKKQQTNWKKPLSALAISIVISIAAPLSVNMYYNLDYYFPPIQVLKSAKSMNNHFSIQILDEMIIAVNTKETPTLHTTKPINKATLPQQKEWICDPARKLIQGSGNVRECSWK